MKKRQSHYLKIDDNMRRTIVFEVMIMKESLKNVCDRYGINFSSAKNVIQIYRKEGRLEKKIQKARKTGSKGNKNEGSEEVSDLEEDGLDDENCEYEDDGTKVVTIAPEEMRCKLNLFVYPLEDEDPNSSGAD
jgi:ribosomal protein S25